MLSNPIVKASSYFLFLCLLVSMLCVSCYNSDDIGGTIIDDSVIELQTQTFDIVLKQIKGEAERYYAPTEPIKYPNYFNIGNSQDGVMGRNENSMFLQYVPKLRYKDLSNEVVEIDSVVLQLPYDSAYFFGEKGFAHEIEIYRMMENPDVGRNYYTSDTFAYGAKLGSASIVPNVEDLVTLGIDTFQRGPHARIRLDDALGSEIIGLDSNTLYTPELFMDVFSGIYIKDKNVSNEFMGFNITSDDAPFGIIIYYNINDTSSSFDLVPSSSSGTVALQHIAFDFENSKAGDALAGSNADSSVYVLGNGGLTFSLEIQGLESLQDALINRAEIELVHDEDFSTNFFPIMDSYTLIELDITGNWIDLPEFRLFNSVIQRQENSQGQLVDFFNIPFYTQLAAQGKVVNTELRLDPNENVNNPFSPSRFAYYNNRVGERRARLKVYYTTD